MKWPLHNLSDICEIIMGQAPSGDTYNTEGHGFLLIAGAGDFKDGEVCAKKYTTSPTKKSKVGDVILGIRASIGEKVWAREVYCLGRGVAALRVKNNIDKNYLWHTITFLKHELASKGRGATFKQVNKDDICDLKIPLPPLAEQQRIAELLDTADNILRKRQQAIAKLDQLAHSVFVEIFLNKKETLKLKETCKFISGGTPSRENKSFWNGETPWISSADIEYDEIKSVRHYVNDLAIQNSATNLIPANNILVVTRTGVGKALVNDRDICFSQDITGLLLKEGFAPEFIAAAIRQKNSEILKQARGATIKGVTREVIESLDIPKATFDEQINFSKRISLIKNLKNNYREHEISLLQLQSSLQHQSFAVN